MSSNKIMLFFIFLLIFDFIKSDCSENYIEISYSNPSRCVEYTKIISKESGLLSENEVNSVYEKYKGKVVTLSSDVKFEILKTTDFTSYINELDSSISTIEVTNDCVNTLVGTTHKNNMYIFKFDIISSSSSFNNVHFSLYYDEDFIDNPICTSSPIIITYPINTNYLFENDNNQKERMKLVIEQGYDPFNKNSDFFTDICTQFTSEDNTDVPLDDRKEDYFISINACNSENENSIYDSYIIGDDTSNLFIKCAYGKFETEEEKNEAIDIIENGINTVFTHSNLKIVKCNKMLFKLKYFKKNYGSWIIMGLFVLQIVFLVFYIKYGTKGIYDAIKEFFKKKGLYFKNEEDQKTKNEEENKIPSLRSTINKSKTKEVRKAVTENLEIRYQDYANPPLKKKKKSNYENEEDLEFNSNINIQKPNINNEIIRTQMNMLDVIQSKNNEDDKKKSVNNKVNSNFKKVNSNASDNLRKVNSNESNANNINFGDFDNFENNDEELIYQESENVDLGKVDNRVPTNYDNEDVKMINSNDKTKNYNNYDDRPIKSNGFYDFESINNNDKPKNNNNNYDDRPIRSNGFYNLESLDSGSINDLLLSSQNKNNNSNDNNNKSKVNNKNNVNNNNNKTKENNKNNVIKSQEVKGNNQQKLNTTGSKFANTTKPNNMKKEDINDKTKKEIPKTEDKNPINQTNNSPSNNPLLKSENNIPIQRLNSRFAHLQMSADNPFNTNPNLNSYNNYPIRTYNSMNENIDNINNNNDNIKNNTKLNNNSMNDNKLNINKSSSFNETNMNDTGPIIGLNVAKSTSFNEQSKNKRDNALKLLNGTSLHKVEEDQDQENSLSNDDLNKDPEEVKIESSNKNKFNNIDISQSNSLQKKNSKSNSNTNYYPSDLNDRKSYKRNTNNENIEENIEEENKNEELNKSNRSNKSDVIGTTGHLFDYTDEELNDLPYEKAFYADGRSYYCYYWSILKYDQLFLFSFILWSDFNLRLVKVSLFFFHIPMYITFNGFFFSDTAARNLYKKKGIISIIERLPSSIFSSLICFVIVIILKCLCLSQKKVQEVRSSKTFDEAYEKTQILVEKMKPRIIFYFVLMFIFMIIFIYYISLFCAVFKNTQWKLLEETGVSFALGMFYPFIICIFPTIFRKIGLIKQKKCSYKFSQFLQLF